MNNRRPELDWLRVIAIVLLHVFHVGMMFNTWSWHLKNPQTLPQLEPTMELLHALRMPLLMLISGFGTAFALRRRTVGAFALDRTKRLLLPLVFGMFVIVPPQIYFERLASGAFTGSYAAFYPSVFAFVPYPNGSFSWHHLWFVAYLFVYCMLSLPLLAALETPRGRRALTALEGIWARGWPVAALGVLLMAERFVLRAWPETHSLVDDPRTFFFYALLFVFGNLLARSTAFWEHVTRSRWRYAAAAAIGLAVEANGLIVWLALLACLGLARAWFEHRPRTRPWLENARGVTYPFYIFHQTVIVAAGWAWLQVDLGPWSRLVAVGLSSFAVTWLLSEAVSRAALLRPLFGLPPRPSPGQWATAQ
jgi:peptidoglycan/LPS O-acetylase OafA/YrhL